MPSYVIQQLTDDLVYIKWHSSSTVGAAESSFISTLTALMNTSSCPLFIISDLRQGRITDVNIIKQLAGLTKHKNYGGSTAFGNNPLSSIFVGTFSILANQKANHKEMQDTPEAALIALEELKPGITTSVDWNELLK